MVDLKEETLSAAKASLAAELQDKVLCVAADVSREGDTAHYVEATVKRFGRLDISVQVCLIGNRLCRKRTQQNFPHRTPV